jgi:hypothetical protein
MGCGPTDIEVGNRVGFSPHFQLTNSFRLSSSSGETVVVLRLRGNIKQPGSCWYFQGKRDFNPLTAALIGGGVMHPNSGDWDKVQSAERTKIIFV